MTRLSIWALAAAYFFILAVTFASGQEKHDHSALGKVGQFYETWTIPPARETSCCNEKDCDAVTMKREGGKWWAIGHKLHPGPILIPDDKLEQNLTTVEPRDSPDGRSHACINPYTLYVYCATLGSGT